MEDFGQPKQRYDSVPMPGTSQVRAQGDKERDDVHFCTSSKDDIHMLFNTVCTHFQVADKSITSTNK